MKGFYFCSLHSRRHTNPQSVAGSGHDFRVSDIPRDLRGGCGLCIWLTCPRRGNTMVIPGLTESIYCQQDGVWRRIAH